MNMWVSCRRGTAPTKNFPNSRPDKNLTMIALSYRAAFTTACVIWLSHSHVGVNDRYVPVLEVGEHHELPKMRCRCHRKLRAGRSLSWHRRWLVLRRLRP